MDEDGNIVNNGGHMPPGLNRGEKPDKDDNPNPPEVPEDPGTEDSSDKSANKANKGTHIYTYDKRGNRVAETGKKESRAFVYDETNRLVEDTNWNL